jgi:hypothetical protein
MRVIWNVYRAGEWVAAFADEQVARQWIRHRRDPWDYTVEGVVVEEPAAVKVEEMPS